MDISEKPLNPPINDDFLHKGRQHDAEARFLGVGVTVYSPEPQIEIKKNDNLGPSITERFSVLFSQLNNPDGVREMIGKSFSDNDTSTAKRLLSIYGVKSLSECTCPFIFQDITYPDISPFALACRTGNLDIVRALYIDQKQLDQGFDAIGGTNGRTPLMLATMKGHVEVVRQLLEWGADPQVVDSVDACVEEINYAFNRGIICTEIDDLLKIHREKNGLPKFKHKGSAVVYGNEQTGTNSCRVQ